MKSIVRLLFLCLAFPLLSQSWFNGHSSPTVYVQKVQEKDVFHTIVYSAMVEPYAIYPQTTVFRGVVYDFSIHIGDYVVENEELYNMQQVSPGKFFNKAWVVSNNTGVVTNIHVKYGQEVSAGEKIMTIADLRSYRIKFKMSPKDIDKIKLGDPVYLYSNSKMINIGAKVSEIPLVPDRTNFFTVHVLAKKSKLLYLGQYVKFSLKTEPFRGLVVPQKLIVRRDGKDTVTIVKDNQIVYQPVVLGVLYDTDYSVISGLSLNDLLVTGSNKRYSEGEYVKVEQAK